MKFAHLAEKSGKGSIPNLSTKVSASPIAVDFSVCLDLQKHANVSYVVASFVPSSVTCV